MSLGGYDGPESLHEWAKCYDRVIKKLEELERRLRENKETMNLVAAVFEARNQQKALAYLKTHLEKMGYSFQTIPNDNRTLK